MNIRLLLGFTAPYRASLYLSEALMLTGSLAALAMPWLGGLFASEILSSGTGSGLVLLWLFLLLAAQALLKFFTTELLARTSSSILADLRLRVYDHLQALPLRFHQQRSQGDVLTLMTHEASQLAGFLTGTLLSIGPLLFTTVGAVLLMFRIDTLLAAIVTLLMPVFFFLLKVLGRELRPLALELQKAYASAVAVADENIGMLPAIKTFTREVEESQRYAHHVELLRTLGLRQQRINASIEPTVQFIAAAAVISLLWVAGGRIGGGQMTPAGLVSFLLYAALLTRPVASLAGVYGQTQMALGTFERLQGVFNEKREPLSDSGPAMPRVKGEIELRDVHFAYPGRPEAMAGLSLKIRAGDTVAITGENGAGKSTLAHLLMRLHHPDSGMVLIDGVDIANVNLRSLRRQIGIVPQHTLLFNGTVRDNIGFGLPGAEQDQIERAARLAQATGFVSQLPQGYDTVIGDHGIRLSGGQRQRIALARALLKDPPILILDEATAMFDLASEKAFVDACRDSLKRRTVILITHRPATLALADRTYRIEHGVATLETEPLVLDQV
jgi:ABC-type multidrug transport system fused ATPase/permease subunit